MLDKKLYLEEMIWLVDLTHRNFQAEYPEYPIFRINLFTDVNQQFSGISIDSRKHQQVWLKKNQNASADWTVSRSGADVDNSPASFEHYNYRTIKHFSFPNNWGETSHGKCWKEITPLLTKIAKYCLLKFQSYRLDEGFELSINRKNRPIARVWNNE